MRSDLLGGEERGAGNAGNATYMQHCLFSYRVDKNH